MLIFPCVCYCVHLCICVSVYLYSFICLVVCLYTYLFICLFVYVSFDAICDLSCVTGSTELVVPSGLDSIL